MSDTVTNLVGNAESRTTPAAGFQKFQVPLSDLFADVLNKTNFADRMLPQTELGLARAVERDYELRPDNYNDDQNRADSEPVDDTSSEAHESDDRPQDGDQAADDGSVDVQPQHGGASDTTQFSEMSSDDALLALNAAANSAQKTGPTAQPKDASGVALRSKADGATGDPARVIANRGEIQAAARHAANADRAGVSGQDTLAAAIAKLGNGQAGTNVQNPDAAISDKPQTQNGPVLTQTSGASDGDADGVGALLEKHARLVRAGAKRAAELHQMKIRLEAHRDAIKKVIAQSSSGSRGIQAKPTALGIDKPSIEITASATPPAAAGAAARPAASFNAQMPGALPGQASATAVSNAKIGDGAGNGLDQSAAATNRQTMTSNTAQSVKLRPLPPQPAYQPAEQVKVHIQQLVKSDSDRIHVKLSPASLGRVEVTLEMGSDKTVQAIVYAEKPETLDMLERDARVLQKAFEEAGMKFDSDSLMFKHGQSGDSDTELADGSTSSGTDASADGDGSDAGDAATLEPPNRRQHDGMLDLEI